MPSIQPSQLAKQLRSELSSCYVIAGNEALTSHESMDLIRQKARKQGAEERQVFIVERSFDWSSVIHLIQSGSLFSSQRLVEIRIPTGKPGTEGSKALQTIIEGSLVDTTLIIQLPNLDREIKKSAWFKALEKKATIVLANELPLDLLPQWIGDRLAKQNQTASQETLAFLAQQVEGNLLAANQEIQKLSLICPEGHLADDEVKAAVLNVSKHDSFQLAEAVLGGDIKRTVLILNSLQDEGEKPIQVLFPLTWSFRPLTQLKLAYTRNESLDPIFSRARIFGPKQNLLKGAIKKLNIKQIDRTLQKLADIDQMTKGIQQGDAWHEISRLCFGLARLCAR